MVMNFHVLAKPIGPICNLDCKYCFYLEKEVLYPETSKWSMREEVLDSYIRQYIEAHDSPTVTFAWQGGEPTLLGVDYFRRLVEIQKKYADGKRIENAFQTNGVLLNDTWAELFKENSFLIGLSIDGPGELHDRYSVDKGGQPTFAKVMRGMDVLRRNGVDFNTLTTVHSGNADHPLEVYRFLKESGSHYMQFIPIAERIANSVTVDGLQLVSPDFVGEVRLASWSVKPRQFGRFLCTIFDEWVSSDVGNIFVQLFDVSLQMWCGMEASLCVFRRQCGGALAIEHCGDVYSCDHFVFPENRLGNIMETPLVSLVDSPMQHRFGEAKEVSLPQYCRECDVRFACNGECPKHRFIKSPDGEPGLNYLCAGYKMFFHHIDPYMRFMAAELVAGRAPANVMHWVAARQMQTAVHELGRNDLCPCNSGKKVKYCCGTKGLRRL